MDQVFVILDLNTASSDVQFYLQHVADSLTRNCPINRYISIANQVIYLTDVYDS